MQLNQLNKGDHATILKINANKILKDRFASFGIMRGEEISVKGYSIGKQTMEIEAGATLIALRADEAMKIEVEKRA